MKKHLKIILPIGAVLIVAAVVLIFVLTRKESYRSIQVYNIEGTAEVDRERVGIMDAYIGMRLQSKDNVTVETDSYLYLLLDEDKYILLEPGTKVQLEATGSSAESKTVINLLQGAIVSRLDSELSDNSSYEINTPNSTMAVRGTVFRVEVIIEQDGATTKTAVNVSDGKVVSRLIQPDGETSEEEKEIPMGMSIKITGTEKETEYSTELIGNDYSELESEVLEFLLTTAKEGTELDIPEETLEEMIEEREKLTPTPSPSPTPTPSPTPVPEEFTVTFRYHGVDFAVQKVTEGGCVKVPFAMPAPSGHWDYDFDVPITGDTVIVWKDE